MEGSRQECTKARYLYALSRVVGYTIAMFLRVLTFLWCLTAIFFMGACMTANDEYLTVGENRYRIEPLWPSELTGPQAAAGFVAEGTDKVSVRDGWYWIDASSGARPFSTVWLPGDYPADIRIRYKARLPAPGGPRNINLFFCARLADGRDVLAETDQRTGDYGQYHQFPNYIFTYLGHDQLRVRMRRDPGFELLCERYFPEPVPLDTDLELEVRVAGGWIEYHELAPHARPLLHYRDPDPLPGGRIGLRTWRTHVGFGDIRVDRLIPADQ